MKAHQIISSHLKLFIENLHKKYLDDQIKPLYPVLCAVRYCKVVIVGLSCDINKEIAHHCFIFYLKLKP